MCPPVSKCRQDNNNTEFGLKMCSMQVQREKLLAREALFESELRAAKDRHGGVRKTSMHSFGKR